MQPVAISSWRLLFDGSQSSAWVRLPLPVSRSTTGGSLTLLAFWRLGVSASSTTRSRVHVEQRSSELASTSGSVASNTRMFWIGPERAVLPANTRWAPRKSPWHGLLPPLPQVSPSEVPRRFSQCRFTDTGPAAAATGITAAERQRPVAVS